MGFPLMRWFVSLINGWACEIFFDYGMDLFRTIEICARVFENGRQRTHLSEEAFANGDVCGALPAGHYQSIVRLPISSKVV